jgi:hypothetical protein
MVDELSTRERAFALAAARLLGREGERLAASRSAAVAARVAELLADPGRQAAEAVLLDAPLPRGLARVHPSWYAAAAAGRAPPARTHLERCACGHLVAMDGPTDGPTDGPSIAELAALETDELASLLRTLGRRRVALALQRAPREALAQLCARLGDPEAQALLDELRTVRAAPLGDEAKPAARALLEPPAPAWESGPAFLEWAGRGWLAPALAAAGGDHLARVAQRLERSLGEALIAAAPTPAGDVGGAAVEREVARLLRARTG